MTHLLDKKYLIVLPEGATNIEYENGFIYYEMPNKLLEKSIAIPGYNYRILFTRDTETEDGWKGVVDRQFDTYLDYMEEELEHLGNLSNFYFTTATQSGHSLLKSKNIDPVSNWVIVEKI